MNLDAPSKIKVGVLRTTHPEYDKQRDEDLCALYEGGRAVKPERFLIKRRDEKADIYKERCKRFYYIGYLGEIIDSFASQLMQRPPNVAEGKDATPLEDDFWTLFAGSIDGAGTDLAAFIRSRVIHALLHRRSYTWLDMPRAPEGVDTKNLTVAQRDEMGLGRVYAVKISSTELLDYELDDHGNFLWVTIGQSRDARESPYSSKRMRRHRFTQLSDTQFAQYTVEEELEFRDGVWKSKNGDETLNDLEATLTADGEHSFKRVPLIRYELPEGLWVGGKLESVQKQITELDNGISWQQYMSLFAMPWFKSRKPIEPLMGEAYHLQLGPEDSAGYLEPTGAAFESSMKHRSELKDEAFRIVHQMAQSIESSAQTAGRSGESKRRDQQPTEVVLDALGGVARDHVREIYEACATARGEKYDLVITGMDTFDLDVPADFLTNAGLAQMIRIPSPTYKRAIAKKAARLMLPDMTQQQVDEVDNEIDAAPDEEFATFDPTTLMNGGMVEE